MKEKLIQLQFALFFHETELRPDRFIPKIESVFDELFDQIPTILPIPPDAPAEIPVVILNSGDNKYACNISRSRIDFIVNTSNFDVNTNVEVDNFIEKLRPFASMMFGLRKINRFGLIGHYFCKTDNPIKQIQTKFLKNDIGSLQELNLRYNKKFKSSGFDFNHLIEVGQSNQFVNEEMVEGIFIQRDINNVPGELDIQIETVLEVVKTMAPDYYSEGVLEILR